MTVLDPRKQRRARVLRHDAGRRAGNGELPTESAWQRVPVKMRGPYVLTVALAILMAAQASLGLLFQEKYRDREWIKATWFGNDWVTLVVAVPVLVAALLTVRRGPVQYF